MRVYTLTKINSLNHEMKYSMTYTNKEEAKLYMLNDYYNTLAYWVFTLHDNIEDIEHDVTDSDAWLESETARLDWYITESLVRQKQE